MDENNINLNINTGTIEFIISRAHEFHAKKGVTFPDDTSASKYESDPLQILADYKDDLTFREIKQIIEGLDAEQKIELLALMYIGRGDYNANEWKTARQEASHHLQPHLAEYLISKPQLAEYLEQGLESLGYPLSTLV